MKDLDSKMKTLYFFVLFLLLLNSSCTSQSGVQTEIVNLEPIPILIPHGKYEGIVTWFPDETLRIYLNSGESYIEYVEAGSDMIEKIAFDSPESCQYSKYYVGAPLPDGRLGIVHRCTNRWPDNPQPYRDARYMAAYDWETQTLEPLIDTPLSDRLSTGFFSWNPDMSKGVQAINGDRGTIWWITPNGPEAMNIIIGEGERSWSLAENLDILYDDGDVYLNQYDVGNAREPVWSPDGKTIAFLASPSAIGKGGVNRSASPYELYLMDPVQQEPIAVLEGLIEPHGLRWSPDSQWLAFSTAFGRINQRYLGLFSPSLKKLYLLPNSPSATAFHSLAWSPSGTEIAVTEWTAADTLGSEQWQGTFELLLYNISNLISQAERSPH